MKKDRNNRRDRKEPEQCDIHKKGREFPEEVVNNVKQLKINKDKDLMHDGGDRLDWW